MKLFLCAVCSIFLFSAFSFAQSNQSDSFSITTYYPSPYGVYRNLRLFPSQQPTAASESPGTMYFNATTNITYVFVNATERWKPLGGVAGTGGGTLGPNAGDTLVLDELNSKTANNQYLRTVTKRSAAGNDWSTADLYLQRRIDVSDMGFIKWTGADWGIGFGSGTTEYMRITQGGKVGIGTTTPSEVLTVNGNVTATDFCTASGVCLSQLSAYVIDPNKLYKNVHAIAACPGTPVEVGIYQKICQFHNPAGGVCPAGWTQYQQYSATAATGCAGTGVDGRGNPGSMYCACSNGGGGWVTNPDCFTGSHGWSNAPFPETRTCQCGCSYYCGLPATAYTATVTEIGCY